MCAYAVDEVFAGAAQDDLSRYRDFIVLLEANGAILLVAIVEDDGNAGLGDSSLSALVDKFLRAPISTSSSMRLSPTTHLEVRRPNRSQIGEAEHKTYRVEDVGFSRSI